MKPNRHKMIIRWSVEDNAHVVDVPDLPGYMAHGSTRQDAIKNAEDAIKFWTKLQKTTAKPFHNRAGDWFLRNGARPVGN